MTAIPLQIQGDAKQGPALSALDYGAGSHGRFPVLGLHGWLDNAATFDPLAPLLPWASRFVSLDLPGHGWSEPRSSDAPYSLIDYVPDVLRAADALGYDQFVLVAHSLGGAVAGLVAGTRPERLRALILLDILGAMTDTPQDAPKRLRQHLTAAARLQSKSRPSYDSVDEALSARLKSGTYERPAGIRRVIERGLKRETVDGRERFVWRADPRLTLPSPFRLTAAQVAAFLGEITCPTLVIRPEHGLSYDEATVAEFRGAVRDLEVRRVEGYHHVHLDHPEVVAREINGFMATKI